MHDDDDSSHPGMTTGKFKLQVATVGFVLDKLAEAGVALDRVVAKLEKHAEEDDGQYEKIIARLDRRADADTEVRDKVWQRLGSHERQQAAKEAEQDGELHALRRHVDAFKVELGLVAQRATSCATDHTANNSKMNSDIVALRAEVASLQREVSERWPNELAVADSHSTRAQSDIDVVRPAVARLESYFTKDGLLSVKFIRLNATAAGLVQELARITPLVDDLVKRAAKEDAVPAENRSRALVIAAFVSSFCALAGIATTWIVLSLRATPS